MRLELKRAPFNFNKANWPEFQSLLQKVEINGNIDIYSLNYIITKAIHLASIPLLNHNRSFSKPLPERILNFIAERRRARKKLVKTRTEEDKREYYRLSRKVNEEVRKHKNECWLQFLGKIGPSHVSSMPFWKKINSYRKAKSKKIRTPTLIRTGAHIHFKTNLI